MIYLVNLSDKDFIRKKNKWLIKIKEWVDKNDPGAIIIPFSGAWEHKIADIEDETERQAYIDEHKCPSVLSKIILAGFSALHLEYFFTAGADEVKAWTIQTGTKAPQVRNKKVSMKNKKISRFEIEIQKLIHFLINYPFDFPNRPPVESILISKKASLWLTSCISRISRKKATMLLAKLPENIANKAETTRSKTETSFSSSSTPVLV